MTRAKLKIEVDVGRHLAVQQERPHHPEMHAIAILRTLVVTLGLLVFSPWQQTETVAATPAQAMSATCLAVACGPAGVTTARVDRTDLLDLAIVVMSSDRASHDDACTPSRRDDGRPAESRAISRAEPRPVRVARAQPDGPERPPKAGSHLPT